MSKNNEKVISWRKNKMKVLLPLLMIGLALLAVPQKSFAQGEAQCHSCF